jgi:hypothetical protein
VRVALKPRNPFASMFVNDESRALGVRARSSVRDAEVGLRECAAVSDSDSSDGDPVESITGSVVRFWHAVLS